MVQGKTKTIFIAIILLILAIIAVLYFQENKTMKKHRKYGGVYFWVLKKNKIEEALQIWPSMSKAKLLVMLTEMKKKMHEINPEKLRKSRYFELEDAFTNADKNIYLYPEIERLNRKLESLNKNDDIDLSRSSAFLWSIMDTYQFMIAGDMFSELWFQRPYIHFTQEFIEYELTFKNDYIRQNPFYLRGDIVFKRYEFEEQLLGAKAEDRYCYMSYIPIEYAQKVLEYRDKNRTEHIQEQIFYEMMERTVSNESLVFMIELD